MYVWLGYLECNADFSPSLNLNNPWTNAEVRSRICTSRRSSLESPSLCFGSFLVVIHNASK